MSHLPDRELSRLRSITTPPPRAEASPAPCAPTRCKKTHVGPGRHGLLIVHVLLLLQADDVRDAHHLQREEALGLLLPDQLHAPE
ncbi:hypothetical protein Cadr_000003802, partial [Camelus dromedarius]